MQVNCWPLTGTVSIGTLADTCDSSREQGFLSLVRLVGTVYMKKYLPFFKHDSPRTLFNSFPSDDPVAQHKLWYECVRSTVWERIGLREDELPPSWEALRRHWLRSCWVSHFWSQACSSRYHLLALHDNGWKVVEDALAIDWDDPDNTEQVKENVRLLLYGCGCKSGCSTKRCSCCKAGRRCGPGCRCRNCQNVSSFTQVSSTSQTETSNDVEEEELVDDSNIRQLYHSELVDDEDGEVMSYVDDVEASPADSDLDENL